MGLKSVLMLCLLARGEGRPTKERIKEFNMEVARRLQEAGSPCVSALNSHYTHVMEWPQTDMGAASWHDLPDLGVQGYCNDISEDTNYIVSNLNVTYIPATFRFGLCLPKACTQHDFNYAGYSISNSVNRFLTSIFTAMDLESLPTRERILSSDDVSATRLSKDPLINSHKDFWVEMFYRNVDDYVGSWLQTRKAGMIVTLVLASVILIALFLVSWYASCVLNRKRRTALEEQGINVDAEHRVG
jgi:hypothetical protein